MTKYQWTLVRQAHILRHLSEQLEQWNGFNRFWRIEMYNPLVFQSPPPGTKHEEGGASR